MGGRDHTEPCPACGFERGGLDDVPCDCDGPSVTRDPVELLRGLRSMGASMVQGELAYAVMDELDRRGSAASTGFERYLGERLKDPRFAAGYQHALARIKSDAVVNETSRLLEAAGSSGSDCGLTLGPPGCAPCDLLRRAPELLSKLVDGLEDAELRAYDAETHADAFAEDYRKMREHLQEFGQHKEDCGVFKDDHVTDQQYSCTCGLDKLLEAPRLDL